MREKKKGQKHPSSGAKKRKTRDLREGKKKKKHATALRSSEEGEKKEGVCVALA